MPHLAGFSLLRNAVEAGGSMFGASPEFGSFAVSKQEYEEFGHTICKIRFADW